MATPDQNGEYHFTGPSGKKVWTPKGVVTFGEDVYSTENEEVANCLEKADEVRELTNDEWLKKKTINPTEGETETPEVQPQVTPQNPDGTLDPSVPPSDEPNDLPDTQETPQENSTSGETPVTEQGFEPYEEDEEGDEEAEDEELVDAGDNELPEYPTDPAERTNPTNVPETLQQEHEKRENDINKDRDPLPTENDIAAVREGVNNPENPTYPPEDEQTEPNEVPLGGGTTNPTPGGDGLDGGNGFTPSPSTDTSTDSSSVN